jgi:hypothetical protein
VAGRIEDRLRLPRLGFAPDEQAAAAKVTAATAMALSPSLRLRLI